MVDAALDSIRQELRLRGRVAIKGFGVFELRVRKGRRYRHPRTGRTIAVGDKQTIGFKPSQQLVAATKPGGQAN